MKKRSHTDWIASVGLEPCQEENGVVVYRRVKFGRKQSLHEMEETIRLRLRREREACGITVKGLGLLLGLSHQVVRRCENKTTRLPISRLIHYCEVLNIHPLNILFDVAPHVFGVTPETADIRRDIINALFGMDEQALCAVMEIILSAQKLGEQSGNAGR